MLEKIKKNGECILKELSYEDIIKNKVNTISQFHILDYLKQNLNIDEFKIYLVDRDNIKVLDKNNDCLYFHYDNKNKKVTYQKKLNKEYEIGL